MNLKNLRIEVPCFDGSDVLGWCFKIEQYFDYHEASEKRCLNITPFYFDGKHYLGINGCSRKSKLQVGGMFYKHWRPDLGLLKWRIMKVNCLNYVNPVLFGNIMPLRIYQPSSWIIKFLFA